MSSISDAPLMSSDFGIQHLVMPFEGNQPGPSHMGIESPSATPPAADATDLLRLLTDGNGYGSSDSPKAHLERLLSGAMDVSHEQFPLGIDIGTFGMAMDIPMQYGDMGGMVALRNSSKTLKCPKCNWHYKYQETLEIHMKEKHSDGDVRCVFCVENRVHPKLARGESYSCGYKPYRCELCKYSTTTKGNLSIHMQSDKHLHAMQELPTSIASLACPPSSARSPVQDGDKTFVCVVCGCFSSDSLQEMMQHADKDRSRPTHGDISMNNGVFRCHLCPYNTNLKANFQLHTRTDKHLQRVQMVNHIREGSTTSSALCRLGNAKSVFQVLCRPCQEILPSASSLREHFESVSHRTNLRQPITHYQCSVCTFETPHKSEAIAHMTCHEPSTWPQNTVDFDVITMEEDAAYACASCGFATREATTLEEHARSHEEGEQCPLCTDRTLKLTEHLIQEHKIAESAVERLLSVHPPESASSSANNFSFRCPQCAMAFRNESSLQSHSILHLFSTSQKCPTCSTMCSTNEELKSHIETEHPKEEESRCELCQEAFSSKTALVAHFNSVRHLHKAKKQLEQQGSVDLSAQVLAVLNPSSPGDKKPFRCNICKIGYGQGATLDIHLRSVAHQSRMSKIADLVANGDIDASKPVLEQPGGPAQRIIRDLMDRDDEPVSAQQQNVMTMFNIMNMLMGQNQGMPMSFSTAKTISGEGTPDNEDDISSPKNAIAFAAMLKAFGNEKVIFLAPGLSDKISRISEIADEKIETISRVNCTECGEDQSSILALSFHVEELHSGIIPENTLRSFAERLLFAICELDDTLQGPSSNGHESPTTSRTASRDDSEPPEKRPRSETSPLDAPKPDLAQMAMLSMMGGFPFMPPNPLGGFMPSMGDFFNPMMAQHMQLASSPAKRARTRITDEQLKILRQYFDINNSPSENQIKEMSLKAGLPEKVIKHWFRNTLFKERQRDKDSPYNFNVPPQMGIDLDTYEKTGETKVVPLATDVKRDQPDEIESKPTELSSSVPPLNLQAMMQQMQQANPFQFMDPAGMMGGSLSQLPQSGASSGRRANRTRFTDYQLRTLQQFFDKQAYPKDDDLEILSKKLQLSPRVIVVWFQNARQKARKIYENQPNHESNDRFVRTPGCNFQCKRCNLVFQRYYELIQHQQKKCYKDDGLAQANDNKGVEESLTEDEKAQLAQQATLATIAETKPADLLKLLGTSKSSTEALLKMCESAGASSSPSSSSGGFHKRCPFCGLLFRNKLSLTEHIPSRHPQQHAITLVDVDLLPNAEDVPVLIPPAILENREIAGVLDLSNSTQDRESLSMSPFLGQSDGDDGTEYIDDVSFPSFIGGPSTPHQAGGGRSPANNKRYRTHLTPTQVHVMKCVFADYKTPSMTECEFLGREIGLHKRVVQVWFQNARAKERKTRTSNGDDDLIRSSVTNCTACGVEYSGRITMQDHLFTSQHLARLKGQLRSDDTHAEPTSYPVENGNDIKTIARTAIKSKGLCPSQLNIANLNGFPFNFINGMLPGTLPLMYDTAMFGTPVPMLQIPESVKSQIKSDITAGSASSRFTQDGETVEDLRAKLSGDDARCLSAKEIEVGWACPSCTNVFQQEPLLKNHQRTVCQGTDTVLTLVQIHYECSTCSIRLGTQKEFCAHCESAEHQLVIRSTSSSAQ